jgi:hypothetical protein
MAAEPYKKLIDVSDPRRLMRAVIRTYEQYDLDGKKPGADHWTVDTKMYRPKMLAAVFDDWAADAETDMYFPWTDDFIGHCWLTWRKMQSGNKNIMRVSLGLMTLFDEATDDDIVTVPKT